MALENGAFAVFGIGDLGEAELVTVEFGDLGDEIEGVDRLRGWMVKEPGDVEDAAFVFEVGFVAVEDEFPNPHAFAQAIPG